MTAGAHPGGRGIFGARRDDRTSARSRSIVGGPVRFVRSVGAGLAVTVIFLVSAVAGALVHMGMPPARRIAVAQANTVLGALLVGGFRIDAVGGLGLFGLRGVDATLIGADGRPVLVVRGAGVHIATLAAARSALFGKGSPMTVSLGELSVDDIDARLDTDPDGKLALLNALAAKHPTAPDPKARGLRLVISRIDVKRVTAHGQMSGAPYLDVRLDDFAGSLTYAPDVLEADVARATIAARQIANGLDVHALLRAHVKKPSSPDASIDGRLDWRGIVGTSEHTLVASLDAGRLSAVLEMPQIAADDIRALLPGSRPDGPGVVRFDAHGTLPLIEVSLQAMLGHAGLSAAGTVSVGAAKSAALEVDGHDIDVGEFVASTPASQLGFRGRVTATADADDAVAANLDVRFLGGKLGSNRLPAASIRASAAGRAKAVGGDAEVVVDEPSAPTRMTASFVPAHGGANSIARFTLESDVPDFARVPELQRAPGPALRGSAHLRAEGSVDLERMSLDTKLRAVLRAIAVGTNGMRSATVAAHAYGHIADPHAEATLHVDALSAGGRRFDRVDVALSGAAKAPHVVVAAKGVDAPDVDASVDVSLTGGVSLASSRVVLARAGERATVTASRVSFGPVLRIGDAHIDGLGSPATLAMTLSPHELKARVTSLGIDLARLGRLLHTERTIRSGTLALDADVDLRPGDANGRATVDLTGAALANLDGLAVHIKTQLAGRKFVGQLHAEAGDIATVDIEAPDLSLGGAGPLSWSAWRQAWGNVSFEARADLAKVAATVPPDDLPFAEARGEVVLKGHVARDDLRDMTPDSAISLVTRGLVLTPKTWTSRQIDGVYVVPAPSFRLAGIDFDLDAKVDGDTGDCKLSANLHDAKGELAHVTASAARFPFDDVFHDSRRLMPDLRRTTFDLRVATPERGLGGLPDALKQSYVTGRMESTLTAHGTMIAPTAHLSATVRQSRLAGTSRTLPIELGFDANYDGSKGTATLKAMADGRELLDARGEIDAVASQILEARAAASAPPWRASAHAHLAGFPLDAIAYLDDKVISGLVDGDVSVDDVHKNARADAALTIGSLRVGAVTYKSAKVRATADGKSLDALVHIDQDDGFAETTARAAATWGEALAPALDPARPLDFAITAKNFRIAGLLPFVDKWLDELDGRLDADTRGQLDAKTRGAQLAGSISLTRGALESSAGGGEFHDIGAKITFAPEGVITLEKLTASGMTGRLEATGSARMKGTILEGARAIVVIPADAPIPLSAGGAEIGNVDGRVELSEVASGDGKGMDLHVEVPHVRVALPEGSSTKAQSLGQIPKVRIGSHRGHPMKFVLLPLDQAARPDTMAAESSGGESAIHTHLGDVQIIRGTDLNIGLDGSVDVKSGKTTQVTGQIQLKKGGLLAIQGRDFLIESGTVTFVGGEPDNPEIVVKAGWTAPDGTVVYANFTGPLKTGKVTLTSEPSLPQEEIVELLMFGTAGGQQAQSPSGNATTNAVGAVGGQAAQPLNHALNQMGLGAVTTKVDTSSSSAPKPEVAVQIARDISIQIAVVLGQPPPGVNPDRTLLTVDWRFLSKWSLSSTLGDAGTTIFDLLWQKRY